MAESVAITSMATRYFCHKCNQEINPVLPEFKCPGCSEGFIEELSSDSNLETSSDDSLGNPEVLDLIMDEPHGRYGEILRLLRSLSSSAVDAQQGTSSWDFSLPFIQFLHGNPGDYAWGSQGLDAIMTQLLNSIESNGPPPMPKEEIEKLPIVEISQEDVNKNLQCTVCMEDYKLGEPVKQLQCQHVYHSDCIIPWLEMHGTCPICRKLLSDNEASQRNGSTTTSQGTQPSQQPNSNQRTSNPYHDLLDYD